MAISPELGWELQSLTDASLAERVEELSAEQLTQTTELYLFGQYLVDPWPSLLRFPALQV